jgi:hypothetical protein
MNAWHQSVAAVVMAMLAVVAGCNSCPNVKPHDVTVKLDPGLADPQGKMPSVQIDIVGVNEAERQRWVDKSVDEYWRSGDPLRSTPDKAVMTFRPDELSKTLAASDPLWSKWIGKGATDMVIMGYIPGVIGSGATDSRRLVLPMDRCKWADDQPIQVLVGRNGLNLMTPLKPPKK